MYSFSKREARIRKYWLAFSILSALAQTFLVARLLIQLHVPLIDLLGLATFRLFFFYAYFSTIYGSNGTIWLTLNLILGPLIGIALFRVFINPVIYPEIGTTTAYITWSAFIFGTCKWIVSFKLLIINKHVKKFLKKEAPLLCAEYQNQLLQLQQSDSLDSLKKHFYQTLQKFPQWHKHTSNEYNQKKSSLCE